MDNSESRIAGRDFIQEEEAVPVWLLFDQHTYKEKIETHNQLVLWRSDIPTPEMERVVGYQLVTPALNGFASMNDVNAYIRYLSGNWEEANLICRDIQHEARVIAGTNKTEYEWGTFFGGGGRQPAVAVRFDLHNKAFANTVNIRPDVNIVMYDIFKTKEKKIVTSLVEENVVELPEFKIPMAPRRFSPTFGDAPEQVTLSNY